MGKNKNDVMNQPLSNFYTAYVVRDANTNRFLNRRVYSGRIRGVWGPMESAQVFYSAAKASSCASNINARRPEGSAFKAGIRPVLLQRRGS